MLIWLISVPVIIKIYSESDLVCNCLFVCILTVDFVHIKAPGLYIHIQRAISNVLDIEPVHVCSTQVTDLYTEDLHILMIVV